jgi:hypothetical protein
MTETERNKRTSMPSVLDREVSDKAQDAFGHWHFAEALRSLIETPSHVPPFSIGLLGPWGTGKSTIKELYLSDLQNDGSGNRGDRRRDRVHAITFNAWRYGGEDIKACAPPPRIHRTRWRRSDHSTRAFPPGIGVHVEAPVPLGMESGSCRAECGICTRVPSVTRQEYCARPGFSPS